MTDRSSVPSKTSENVEIRVPFNLGIVEVFSFSAENNGGRYELTENGELAIRFPDGRIVIFEGSESYPALLTADMLKNFNSDPTSLLSEVKAQYEDGRNLSGDDISPYSEPDGTADHAPDASDGISSGHFNSNVLAEIAKFISANQNLPIGDVLNPLPDADAIDLLFSLDLDLLFAFFENNSVHATIGNDITYLPGLPDEDPLRGKDPRDEIGIEESNPVASKFAESFAIEDKFLGVEDNLLSGDLFENDIYPNGVAGLTLVTPPGNGTLVLNDDGTFTFTPSPHFSGEVTFEYGFTDPASGIYQSAIAVLDIAPVVDAPVVTAPNFNGHEDIPLALVGLNADLVDQDGSETIEITISNVPVGAIFNGGTNLGGGIWSFTPAEIDVLTFVPGIHLHGTFNLEITATTTERASGESTTISRPFSITIEAEADAPTVNTGTTAVDEDVATIFGTDITYALVDADGSEVISEVEITAIPAGAAVTFVASGAAIVVGNDAIGYTITGTEAEIRATLDSFSITTPLHSDVDFDLNVAVTTTDADGSTATTNDTHTIDIEAEADAPTVVAGTTAVDEDVATIFGTDITYALVDADGSEDITQVVIGNIPAGASVTFGAAFAANVVGNDVIGYTITGTPVQIRAAIDSFSITPPLHSDVDFNLSLAVTTRDADGSTATTNAVHTIDVEAEADAPTVNTGTTAVDEDVPAIFGTDITYALVDADGSEVISEVEITAIPAGAAVTFVASGAAIVVGNDAIGYTITGTEAEIRATLDSFSITTPLHSDVDFDLNVAVTTTDADGSTATTNDTHTIEASAVADAPTGSGSATGVEDSVIAVPITVSLVDNDGSETIDFVTVTAPAGITLGGFGGSGATVVQVGQVWTFTGTDVQIQSALTSLTTTHPLHSDDDFTLAVEVQSIESNPTEGQVTTATASTNFNVDVIVQAVADTPSATGGTYTTDEDIGVALAGIGGGLVDADGSETLSFQITGVDTNASFDTGTNLGGGVWAFTAAQITAGISYNPPPQEHGVFIMTLQSIATEGATGAQVSVPTATGTATIQVTVDPVLDTPTLNNGATTVNEDTIIPLGTDIDLDLVDVDDSQNMIISLTGIPVTHTVNWNGALPGTVTNVGGVYVIDGTAQEAMDLLDSLTVTHPLHDDENFTVNVSVYTEEVGGANVTVNATHAVTVSAVADAPNLATAGGSGNEDTVISIPVTTSLVDTDGSEQLDFVEISGVPVGATFGWNGALPGTVTNPVAGTYRFAGTEAEIQNLLATLTILPDTHSGDDITLSATAQTTEFNPTEGGDVAVLTETTTIPINIDVVPVADQPSVSVGAGAFMGEEDTAIALTGFAGALVDVDGSETLTYQIDSVPNGAAFSAGTDLGGGVWEFTAAEITGGITFTPPLNLHGTFNMNLTSIATEGENSDQATNALPFIVTVDAQADAPLITVSGIGDEDTAINFGAQISVTLFDTDGSESITSIAVDASAFPSAPSFTAQGAAVITLVGSIYTITGTEADMQATLDTFSMTPAAHLDDDIAVAVTVNTIDADGSTNTATANSSIIVRAVADAPTATAIDVVGNEDIWFAINGLTAGASADVDGSETLSAIITNLPTGTEIRVAGVPGATITQVGDDWHIDAPDLVTLNLALAAVELLGPEHFSGTFSAQLQVISTEAATGAQVSVKTATATDDFDITIGSVVDAPVIVATPATDGAAGYEDTPIAIKIDVDNVDNDGSEDLVIEISNIPVGATLSAGIDLGGGVYQLTQAQLAGLTITPPLHSNDDFQLTITATSTENTPGLPGDGDTTATVGTINVSVIGVADVPNVVINPVVSNEDQPIPLGTAVVGSLVDTDGSETLSYVISGLPAGVVPSVGTYIGGEWQVDAADMAGLTIPAPANFSGDYVADFAPTLEVRVVTQEDDGNQTAAQVPLSITVTPVIDAVTVGSSVTVTEGNDISLAGLATSTFADDDGSESITSYDLDFSSIVADAQIGTVVTDANDFISNYINGTFVDNLDGTITVAPADIAGISLKASAFLDSNIDFTIPVVTHIEDVAGATIVTGTTNTNFSVNLVGDADTPTVFAADVGGNDATLLALNPTGNEFGGDTTDTDTGLGRAQSEDIFYIVSGVQDNPNITMVFTDGAGNIVGLNNNDGTWLLTPSDLADLHINTAGGSNGMVTLTLTTVATEDDGDVALNATTFDLTVVDTGGGPGIIVPLPPIVTINAMPTNEDGAVTFDVTAVPDPADPSPTVPTVNVIIGGVPLGATIAGATFNPITNLWIASAAVVNGGGVTVTPPADFSGTMNITIEAVATNSNLLSATTGALASPIEVAPVADGPAITIATPDGNEDTAIALNITVALNDTNGTLNEVINEPITVTVDNGAILSAGVDLGGGVYELTQAELVGLTVTPALHSHGTVNVTVSASTTEPGNGDTQITVANGTISVAAVADAPTITVANAVGNEDSAIALAGLSAALVDVDGSEVLSTTISGVPEDSILSAGTNNGDGSWTVAPGDLATLTITPPLNYSGIIALTLEAFSLELSNGDTATTAGAFNVTVNPVADNVIMTLLPQSGDEGTDVALDLALQLGDATGVLAGENPGETVEITFTGVPDGILINALGGGTITDQGAGQWFFAGTETQANALSAFSTGPDGDFTINVSAQSNDNGSTVLATVGTLDLTFNQIADQVLNGSGAANTLTGAAGDDTIDGNGGADIIDGGSGYDTIFGGSGTDTITGGLGNDTIDGGGQNDIIIGGQGDDTISGGSGNDTITGGQGVDTLTGGGGADTFIWGVGDTDSVDTITDFSTGNLDALDFSALLPGYNLGVDALTDFVNLVEAGGDTTVQIDQTGTAKFTTDVVVLTGVTGLDVNTLEANNNLIV